jgi:hypothetical protein
MREGGGGVRHRVDWAGYGHDEGGRAPAQASLSTEPACAVLRGLRLGKGGVRWDDGSRPRMHTDGRKRNTAIGLDIAVFDACLGGTMIRAPVLSSIRRMLHCSISVAVRCR